MHMIKKGQLRCPGGLAFSPDLALYDSLRSQSLALERGTQQMAPEREVP
jgi:hypothetical protein